VIGDVILVVVIAGLAAVGGIVLGMLLAPRIGRLAEGGEHEAAPEEPGDERES
jgi:hypothetical protein